MRKTSGWRIGYIVKRSSLGSRRGSRMGEGEGEEGEEVEGASGSSSSASGDAEDAASACSEPSGPFSARTRASPASSSRPGAWSSPLVAAREASTLFKEGPGVTGDGAEEDDAAVLSSSPTPWPSRLSSRLPRAFLGGVECSAACDVDAPALSPASSARELSREAESPAVAAASSSFLASIGVLMLL